MRFSQWRRTDLRVVLELEHARQRLAGAVVGAALREAHALPVADHGGEPGVAQRLGEVRGKVGEDGAQEGLRVARLVREGVSSSMALGLLRSRART